MRIALSYMLAAAFFCGCGANPVWKRQTFAFSVPAAPPANGATTNVIALKRVSISPLFQSQSFTYEVGENAYEHDPYAGFLISPERAVAEAMRSWMRNSRAFGNLAEPGSALIPNVLVEATVTELCGDFRQPSHPGGVMEIHFVVYQADGGFAGRVLVNKTYSHESALARKTPTELMVAWETDLREILESLRADFAKAN